MTVLPNATALGVYDDGYVGGARTHPVEDVVWHVRAGRVVLATGAIERPIAFAGNDLPGVMLAGAAATTYVERYGVLPGRTRGGRSPRTTWASLSPTSCWRPASTSCGRSTRVRASW